MKELLYLTFLSAFLTVGVISVNPTLNMTSPGTNLTMPGSATTPGAAITNVTTPGAAITNVTTPGAAITNVTTPGAAITNVTTPGAAITNVTTPGAAITNVTTPGPTTPPAPKTTAQPKRGKYIYNDCLALFAYISISGKSLSESVPPSAQVKGFCGKTNSSLTLSWKKSNSITFNFANLNGVVYLQQMMVELANDSSNSTLNIKLSADKSYYECPKSEMSVGVYNVTLDDLKVQAFHYNKTFSPSGEMCGASSSVAPSTTEIPASSTVPPTPSPSIPSVDNYTVSGIVNGSTVVCLVMQAAIKLKIPYEGKNKNHTYEGSIGTSPSYRGTCSNTTDTLKIMYGAVTLDLTFTNLGTHYILNELKLTADEKKFKDGKDVIAVSNYTNTKEENQLRLGDYYSCKSKTTLQLTSGVEVYITDLKMAAFRTSNTSKIVGKMVLCPEDQQTNSIVPIAVGAALAGLVVVVLIAYLIGRKRSRRGYESV